MRHGFFLCASVVLVAGCGPRSEPEAPVAPTPKVAAADPWVLKCVDPSASEPAVLWNGLIGLRIGRDGTGTERAMFAIDEYEPKQEEKIVPLANPLAMKLNASSGGESNPLNPRKANDYAQDLDMRTGVLTTSWSQKVGEATLKVRCEAVVHPTERAIAERWHFESDHEVTISQADPYPADGKQPNGHFVTKSGRPYAATVEWKGGADPMVDPNADRTPPVVKSNHSFNVLGTVDDNKPGDAEWTFRFGGRSDKPGSIKAETFEEVLKQAKATWAKRWETDIEIDGPVEDQQAVRSFLFYLRSAVHPKGGMSVAPFGLSSSQYFGHVFWDADLWVFPALSFVDPEAAAAIPTYRLDRLKVAEANFAQWLKEGRPHADGKLGPADSGVKLEGAKFPWESSVSGKETVPGPSKYEDHITGTVAFSLEQAARLGLAPEAKVREIVEKAGTFYFARSEPGKGKERVLRSTMSPDENHTGDNDLYTNLLATWCLNGGSFASEVPRLQLPKDDKTFLTYDNDAFRGYKQAAAMLSVYPLQYGPAEKQARAMMDRFADKTIKNGPAMTDSIYATIWSRLGEKEKGYHAWQNSWVPFAKSPLMLFSEKRIRPTAYFTTGAAGSLQTVLYGFLGFRLDYDKKPGAAWATQLKGDTWLSIKPNLPTQWKSVKFKNFNVLGRRYTLVASPHAASVTSGE